MVAVARSRRPLPQREDLPPFAADVVEGLSVTPKRIPAKYFYDARGSELFEQITELPEYYPTRCEMEILREKAGEIAALIPENAAVVEFGSGSNKKARLLLAAAPHITAYVPVDISAEMLEAEAAELRADFPGLAVLPVAADFCYPFELPEAARTAPLRVGFFPGSTIGNFVPSSGTDLLRQFRSLLGVGSQLLIGLDRVKPVERLIAAYDDPEGVTAQFTLNILTRINRELDGDIPVDAFRHEARWNDILSRIEIHLVAMRDLAFSISGRRFAFAAGSSIHVENSHKYGPRGARLLLLAGGWTPVAEWTDPAEDFAEILAVAEPERFAP